MFVPDVLSWAFLLFGINHSIERERKEKERLERIHQEEERLQQEEERLERPV